MNRFRLFLFFFAIASMGCSAADGEELIVESEAVNGITRERRHLKNKLCKRFGICQGGFQGGYGGFQGGYGGYQGGYPGQYPPINIAISQSQTSANGAEGGYNPNNNQFNGGYPNNGYFGGYPGQGNYGGYPNQGGYRPGYFGNGPGQFTGNYFAPGAGGPPGGGFGFRPGGPFNDENPDKEEQNDNSPPGSNNDNNQGPGNNDKDQNLSVSGALALGRK
ncbi:unnamed protein product [Diatraea saccharalis]|uniref:Uncharacterized protein n=1 Tax=Diatraea saccharalis TaxID=40085 RepID=A0A9N9RIB9_9NEOP|nr:unnamed protein product [Diatraea saccharalis]